jgi:GT2 family glycosyltransferase
VAPFGDHVTTQAMTCADVSAIVVHHRSYDTVPVTVRALLEQGLPADRVLVVDNSEEPASGIRLASSLPPGVEVAHVANRGYGAAVNSGLDLLNSRGDDARYVLVTSHESRPDESAVARLRTALEDHSSAAVAGPTLVTGHGDERVTWSEGGYLAPVTRRPKHHGFGRPPRAQTDRAPVARRWLDGAFLLYRRADLENFRFSEDYFLYMEETDLHLRLGRAGRDVLWVPDAVAWQSSKGVPAYYFARNLRLLYARNDTAWRRRYVARSLVLRRLAGSVLRGRAASEASALLRGSVVRLPSAGPPPGHRVVVVNPLGAALHHYQAELVSVMSGLETEVTLLTTAEPSASGRGRVRWLASYVRLLLKAAAMTRRSSRGKVLVLWPALGYLDLSLLRATAGPKSSLVIHDPVPLVTAIGYGVRAGRLGARLGAGVQVILHSETARRALDPAIGKDRVSVLPHPMLPPARPPSGSPPNRKPVVRVLGQFKPDRDLEALSVLAQHFDSDAVLEVHGRGWPHIAGWAVQSLFVGETEMDSLIASSDVVLIPYRRFFQSGIAIRCLEQGVPAVGPAGSSLEDLYGSQSRLLVHDHNGWAAAVVHAAERGRQEASSAAENWRNSAEKAWREWLAT